MTTALRIGSRPSRLAIVQAELIRELLRRRLPDLGAEIVPIRTTGDALTAGPLSERGGKGLFIKELEEALSARRIDIAVHSMKDLPAALGHRYRLVAVPEREDPRDALVAPSRRTLAELPAGARLGTSSPRRRFEALRVRPDLVVAALRGNVDTRLSRLARGELDAVILAIAGLKRLGRESELKLVKLDRQDFVPAGGQGALAVEALADGPVSGSAELEQALAQLTHRESLAEVTAERAFLAAIGASCTSPVGVNARAAQGRLTLRARLFSLDGRTNLFDSVSDSLGRDGAAARAGASLAERMLERGAGELLRGG